MKTAWATGLAACLVVAFASPSDAGHRRYSRGYSRSVRITNGYGGYGYGGNGYGYGSGYGALRRSMHSAPPFEYRGGYGGYGYGQPISQWHDTSHYDYHPGYAVPHGDHYDVVPGHYHYHPSGHYHDYGW